MSVQAFILIQTEVGKATGVADAVAKIPADIPEADAQAIQIAAMQAFDALGCAGLARCDFFYTYDNEIIINEINTLPGFTGTSVYPKLWQATGVSYSDLITALIDSAMSKA